MNNYFLSVIVQVEKNYHVKVGIKDSADIIAYLLDFLYQVLDKNLIVLELALLFLNIFS
jgi:hypothetical protein